MEALNTYTFPLRCFKSDMNSSFLCKSKVQTAGKPFCLIFDALIVSNYLLLQLQRKKSEMSLKSSIGPSHPISELATSDVCSLRRLETSVIKNRVFS